MAFWRKAPESPTAPSGDVAAESDVETAPPPAAIRPEQRALTDRPVVRAGIYAWAVVGLVALTGALAWALAAVSVVAIPLFLALFPAAVLMPAAEWLKRRVPPALAATGVLLGFLALLVGVGALLAPQVAAEMEGIAASTREGLAELEGLLAQPPLNLSPGELDRIIEDAQAAIRESEQFRAGVFSAVTNVLHILAGLVIALIALFFYLKDGDRIARWLRSLLPQRAQADAEAIGALSWQVIGGYMRGQLAIALIDALLIGIGLAILRVPLALPLAVVVFAGGLFPIVGATIAGAVAVLVALATKGPLIAVLVLLLIIGVQQVEGHLLAPIVLGRATALHPLAVITVLTAGALLLGVLGAFIAVPIAASGARAVGYLRNRTPG